MTTYRVKISGAATIPVVVEANGDTVPNARVINISFPKGEQDTLGGKVYYISGPGQANIEVDGQKISGVPLC